MITLRHVNPNSMADIQFLFALLGERKPHQSISHKKMPTFTEHMRFVKSNPYAAWYIVMVDDSYAAGSTYLTDDNELGIFILREHFGQGYGQAALEVIMEKHEPPFYANINPENKVSQNVFEKLGFRHIQNTYVFGDDDVE